MSLLAAPKGWLESEPPKLNLLLTFCPCGLYGLQGLMKATPPYWTPWGLTHVLVFQGPCES
jgi:hypothetical protein